jgi:hypothetical protein
LTLSLGEKNLSKFGAFRSDYMVIDEKRSLGTWYVGKLYCGL